MAQPKPRPKWSCSWCPKLFRHRQTLESHFKTHTGEAELFKCPHPVCLQTYASDRSLRQHMKTTHTGETKPIKCPHQDCPGSYANIKSLKGHIKRIHEALEQNKVFGCSQCGKTLTSATILRVHLTNVHGTDNERLTCSICSNSFKNKQSLVKHQSQVHVNKDVRPYQCLWCHNKYFKYKDSLKSHVHSHTNEKPYNCPKCTKSFPSRTALQVHRVSHSNEKRCVCPSGCGKAFSTNSGKAQHLARSPACNPNISIKNQKCPLCPKLFWTKSGVKEHLQTHIQERKYSCKICSKSYRKRKDLMEHRGSVHLTESSNVQDKVYLCSECDKCFRSRSGLREHLPVCKKQTFVCDQCGREFKYASSLYSHLKIHSRQGEREIACPFCPKMFWTKSVMRGHLRTHTVEKPFKCEKCHKSYKQSAHLTRHGKRCN